MSNSQAYETSICEMRLTPHRSLGPAGFRNLLIGAGLVSALYSLPFFLIGAWPVIGFLGLDVLLLYWAFRANYRAARAYERLRLTYLEFLLERVSAGGFRRAWRFNPIWVKLERDEHEEFGLLGLRLVAQGKRWEIGGFLGPEQKQQVAVELSRALAQARRGPNATPPDERAR